MMASIRSACRPGFTLVETMLALGLTSVFLLGFMSVWQGVGNSLQIAANQVRGNAEAQLALAQLMRDIETAQSVDASSSAFTLLLHYSAAPNVTWSYRMRADDAAPPYTPNNQAVAATNYVSNLTYVKGGRTAALYRQVNGFPRVMIVPPGILANSNPFGGFDVITSQGGLQILDNRDIGQDTFSTTAQTGDERSYQGFTSQMFRLKSPNAGGKQRNKVSIQLVIQPDARVQPRYLRATAYLKQCF